MRPCKASFYIAPVTSGPSLSLSCTASRTAYQAPAPRSTVGSGDVRSAAPKQSDWSFSNSLILDPSHKRRAPPRAVLALFGITPSACHIQTVSPALPSLSKSLSPSPAIARKLVLTHSSLRSTRDRVHPLLSTSNADALALGALLALDALCLLLVEDGVAGFGHDLLLVLGGGVAGRDEFGHVGYVRGAERDDGRRTAEHVVSVLRVGVGGREGEGGEGGEVELVVGRGRLGVGRVWPFARSLDLEAGSGWCLGG